MTVPPARIKPLIWSLDDGTPFPSDLWIPSHVYGNKTVEVVQDSEEWKAKNGGKPAGSNGTAQQPEPAGVGAGENGSDTIPF